MKQNIIFTIAIIFIVALIYMSFYFISGNVFDLSQYENSPADPRNKNFNDDLAIQLATIGYYSDEIFKNVLTVFGLVFTIFGVAGSIVGYKFLQLSVHSLFEREQESVEQKIKYELDRSAGIEIALSVAHVFIGLSYVTWNKISRSFYENCDLTKVSPLENIGKEDFQLFEKEIDFCLRCLEQGKLKLIEKKNSDSIEVSVRLFTISNDLLFYRTIKYISDLRSKGPASHNDQAELIDMANGLYFEIKRLSLEPNHAKYIMTACSSVALCYLAVGHGNELLTQRGLNILRQIIDGDPGEVQIQAQYTNRADRKLFLNRYRGYKIELGNIGKALDQEISFQKRYHRRRRRII